MYQVIFLQKELSSFFLILSSFYFIVFYKLKHAEIQGKIKILKA